MPAGLCHHVAIQVSDIDRAVSFYDEALDARLLTRWKLVSWEIAAAVMGGPEGTAFEMCRLGFAPGCLELFRFTGEIAPDWAKARAPGRVPHFGVQVDDIERAIDRVEAAGGRRLWPHPETWGAAHTLYAADLDGNVFELCDASLPRLVDLLIGLDPKLAPQGER
jgi:catechol 2,3-dioxygenase-like lactoylglutathione lyase family enzyme